MRTAVAVAIPFLFLAGCSGFQAGLADEDLRRDIKEVTDQIADLKEVIESGGVVDLAKLEELKGRLSDLKDRAEDSTSGLWNQLGFILAGLLSGFLGKSGLDRFLLKKKTKK